MSGPPENDVEQGRKHRRWGRNRKDQRTLEEPHKQVQDFDDNANDLWSLFGKQAKSHDEAWAKDLKEDMGGVLIFAGLFSGVLTAFVVPKIQDLKVNSANQSVYYQNQTVQILDRISRQFASADGQISTNYTPPSPYPTFHPSRSDHVASILWLISLVCSLSAAFLATLIQQWARNYMRIFSQPRIPLRTARIRMYLFERVERLPKLAEVVPMLIHCSLILFFCGLCDIIRQIDKTIFITIVALILVGAFFYLFWVLAPMWNPQLPYRTPFSVDFFNFIQNLRGRASMEKSQEVSAMEGSDGRTKRDVRALQWLMDNINEINGVQTFVLAFIDSFNQKWGRTVWKAVIGDDKSACPVDPPPSRSSPREEATVYRLCRYVRIFLEKERNSTDTDVRRRHMRECIDTMASLVCVTGVELSSFGQVGELLSEVGEKEQTNEPWTSLNPLFTVRWTCLSLVAIKQIVNNSRLQQKAKLALDGIAVFQRIPGSQNTRTAALAVAQSIDNNLSDALRAVSALESSPNQNTTENGTLIQELWDIAKEAVGPRGFDWRISLLQETMDEVTHKLMRRLPGVFIDMLLPTITSEALQPTPIPLQLMLPGQQLQTICTLYRRLRNGIEEQNNELQEDTLIKLANLRERLSLSGLNHMMERQVWRLEDLHDGNGLGFTIELFFLALRQLLSPSSSPDTVTSPSANLTEEFYNRTFEVIKSNWANGKNSNGTQRILLDILCDLVIQKRGIFSDFTYPPYIMNMPLALLKEMVKGKTGSHSHLDDVLIELERVDPAECTGIGIGLRDDVLRAFSRFSDSESG